MTTKTLDKEIIKEFLSTCGEGTKIYLGCDSVRFRLDDRWYADYMLCVIVHINGNNGAKIFAESHRERVWDTNPKKPGMRLMNEVIKVAQLYIDYGDIFDGYEVEVHLDLNPSKKFASSVIVQEALGYIRGTCHIEPKLKPNAIASQTCADWLLKHKNKIPA